jgi:AcrR family transcriptional regulator
LPTALIGSKRRQKRTERLIREVEAVALALFEQRGFASVTVEEIAAEAEISTRTFYRYFPAKEDVLQVRTRLRAGALKYTLAERPVDEPPLHSLRLAIEVAVSAEDAVLFGRWMSVVAATPSVLPTVLGGCILTMNGTMAEFFSSRLGVSANALVPTILAAAAGGVMQAAETRWRLHGGKLAALISQGLSVLEEVVVADLPTRARSKGRSSDKPRDRSHGRKK